MKSLNTYIAERKALHQDVNIAERKALHQDVNIAERKSLHQNVNIQEKLVVNKEYKICENFPQTWTELRNIIKNRFVKEGPGTAQKPINFNDINLSEIHTFYDGNKGIFENMLFKYIDVSEWDVSNVEDMQYTFFNCCNLRSVGDISNWDVSNVEDMHGMFWECKKLLFTGDLSNWDVSNVKDTKMIFFNCIMINTPDWYKE